MTYNFALRFPFRGLFCHFDTANGQYFTECVHLLQCNIGLCGVYSFVYFCLIYNVTHFWLFTDSKRILLQLNNRIFQTYHFLSLATLQTVRISPTLFSWLSVVRQARSICIFYTCALYMLDVPLYVVFAIFRVFSLNLCIKGSCFAIYS